MPLPVAAVQGSVAPLPVHPGDNHVSSSHAEGGSEPSHAASQTAAQESRRTATGGLAPTLPRHPSVTLGEALRAATR